MKKIILLVVFVTGLFSKDVYDYKLKPKKVSENVWCFFGALESPTKENGGNMSNSCYVKTNDSYVLIDSGPSYQYAVQSYEAMKSINKLPVKLIIVTHEHDDHWLGNSFYKEKFSAKLIGSEEININYKDGDQTRMFKTLSKSAIKNTKIVKLDQEIKTPISFIVGGEEFEVIPIGQKAHSYGDNFIYLPKRKVLFSGDLIMNGRITSNRDGSVIGELKAIDMIKSKDWNTLIPGHGYIIDKTAIDESYKYFSLLKARILKALDDDIEAVDITKVVKMQEFENKAMYEVLNGRNVLDAFVEIELIDED